MCEQFIEMSAIQKIGFGLFKITLRCDLYSFYCHIMLLKSCQNQYKLELMQNYLRFLIINVLNNRYHLEFIMKGGRILPLGDSDFGHNNGKQVKC